MKLVQWTLFIDMLGYRDINGAINSEAKAKEFIAFMEENKASLDFSNRDEVKEKYKIDKIFDLYMYYDVQYAFISDSIIITFSPKDVQSLKNNKLKYMHSANALFIILMRLQTIIFNCFSQRGIFLRGGISTKYCYIQNEFAVGDGLICAYKAESNLAVHPRIAFSPEVLQDKELKESITQLSNIMYGGNNIIIRDSDGVYYLDYLGYNLSIVNLDIKMVSDSAIANPSKYLFSLETTKIFCYKHSKAIENKLVELEARKPSLPPDQINNLQKVIEKFLWLKDYHNTVLSKHKNFTSYIIK